MQRIKVALFGLGPVGLEALRHAAAQPWIEIVGAVDHAPELTGRPLTELAGLAALDGLKVARDLEELFCESTPEVILHAASSSVAETFAQLRPALEFGVSAVSTCEELIYPALKSPALARELDTLCRHTGARVVATGVSPSTVLEALPICLAATSREVERIAVSRIVDAAVLRRDWQARIGCGLSVEEFRAELAVGGVGCAGLAESAALLAHAIGWELDAIEETAEPVLAQSAMRSEFFAVQSGAVCGVRQRASARAGGVERVVVELLLRLGAVDAHERVRVDGRPALQLELAGSLGGDDAAAAALVHAVPRLLACERGLRLLSDLPLARAPHRVKK